MNFKVGDICKPIHAGECGTFELNNGKYIKITSIEGDTYRYDILDGNFKEVGERCWNCFKDIDLELANKSGRPVKVKPTLYVAFYEKNKVDPMKEFADLKELKKWLSEAEHDSSIDFDSIIVVPVDQKQGILKIKRTSTFSLTKV